ncbi:MAG: paaE [Marmoricola sp.]|nr:paaE [Marmoricola sp.]
MTITVKRATFHPLVVARVEQLTDDSSAVTFAVPEDLRSDYAFQPGQSVTIRRELGGRDERRTYSICAPVCGDLRIGVRRVAGGAISGWLTAEVRAGDVVDVQSPTGAFVADPDAGGRHVFVAAGSGITPVLSIATSLLQRSAATLTLLYANRHTNSVMFVDDLSDLKNEYGPRLELVHVLSREPREVELFSGRLDRERLATIIAELVPVDAIDHFWLCGPFELVAGTRDLLQELGVPKERIHAELFYVEAAPPTPASHIEPGPDGPTAQVTVVLDGRATELRLPLGETILDAAQRSRADLPFACKGGVCGTCRARVTAGTVDMRRNYALEDSEVADGFVLTCQSFPESPAATVDYDA